MPEEILRLFMPSKIRKSRRVVNRPQGPDNRVMGKREQRFYSYSNYLENRYKEKAYRVAVDAGFSCPNRGVDRSRPGCSYCDEYGAQAVYQDGAGRQFFDRESIRYQINRGVRFMKDRYNAELFLLYFQAFSSTWAPVEKLKEIYDFCLGLHQFRELIVSTRPDCIDAETAALLASYKQKDLDVWVELGLQSASNNTLRKINRGHTVENFIEASEILHAHGIQQTAHVIFGLPDEKWEDMRKTLSVSVDTGMKGIKIHNLHVTKGAPMYRDYLQGELAVPSDRRHLDYVIRALEVLPPETVIHRVTTDTPPHRLAAPLPFWPKGRFYHELRSEMQRRDTWQGRLYDGTPKRNS